MADIEHLKIHKIAPQPEARRLPIAGQATVASSASEAEAEGTKPDTRVEPETLRAHIVDSLKTIFDPEIPVNIYDLGLIYGFDIDEKGAVELRMTLTAPACPVAGILVQDVARKVGAVPGVSRCHATIVWDPPWTQDLLTDEAKLALGLL